MLLIGHPGLARAAEADEWTALPPEQWFNPYQHSTDILSFVESWDGPFAVFSSMRCEVNMQPDQYDEQDLVSAPR